MGLFRFQYALKALLVLSMSLGLVGWVSVEIDCETGHQPIPFGKQAHAHSLTMFDLFVVIHFCDCLFVCPFLHLFFFRLRTHPMA